MSAMLSLDITFSKEIFPFGHYPEGNGDVSSMCFVRERKKEIKKKTNKDRDNELDNVKTDVEQSHDEVYGCLKGGCGNSGGKRLAISKVEEEWLSEKKERWLRCGGGDGSGSGVMMLLVGRGGSDDDDEGGFRGGGSGVGVVVARGAWWFR
ncbi:hypothetical protein Tco_0676118 [Tanacetum coccineum]